MSVTAAAVGLRGLRASQSVSVNFRVPGGLFAGNRAIILWPLQIPPRGLTGVRHRQPRRRLQESLIKTDHLAAWR